MLAFNEISEDPELKEGSCWITVGNISVYIKKGDDGVSVDLYPLGDEMASSLASTWLTYAEADTASDVTGEFEMPFNRGES